MIVNMPSEQELAAAKVKLAQDKNKPQTSQASSSRPPPSQWASSTSQPGQSTSNASQPGQWPADSKSYPPDVKY
jgi:hypothetical protein